MQKHIITAYGGPLNAILSSSSNYKHFLKLILVHIEALQKSLCQQNEVRCELSDPIPVAGEPETLTHTSQHVPP